MQSEPDKDMILDGAAGLYRQVDLKAWGDTSSLISFDSDLKSLGFSFLGDLLCSALAQGILRGYVHPKEHTHGLLLIGMKDGALNVLGLFFDSKFINGATATTTTSRAVRDLPAHRIHRKVCSWKGVYDSYREHRAHLDELRTLNGDTLPMGDTLLSLAESVDASTVRMNSLHLSEHIVGLKTK